MSISSIQVINQKMEGKAVVLIVLTMSLVMTQIQAQTISCCATAAARRKFNMCRLAPWACALEAGCIIIPGPTCPSGFPFDSLKSSGDAITEYCKLGCTSSLCGAITTIQSSDASEIMNGAVAKCAKTCSTICTKTEVEIAA